MLTTRSVCVCSPATVDVVKVEKAQDGRAGNLGNLSSIVITTSYQDCSLDSTICSSCQLSPAHSTHIQAQQTCFTTVKMFSHDAVHREAQAHKASHAQCMHSLHLKTLSSTCLGMQQKDVTWTGSATVQLSPSDQTPESASPTYLVMV